LDVRVDRLHASWDDQMATAAGVNARVLEAARQAGNAIRAAGRTSPTADQNWLEDAWEKGKRQVSGWVDDLKGFVAEHAEAVRSLAKALRVVGIALVVVGAVLAMLGVGTVVMTAGFVLWGASDALLAPKLQAVRNVLRLADSREALARAEQARAGLPGSDEFARKAVAADGEPTLSGWKQPRPDGFTHATPEAVRDYAQRIGHDLARNRAFDQSRRLGSDGWPGRYQASHAEKQQALTAPDHPIAVSNRCAPTVWSSSAVTPSTPAARRS
jgi:hypothetical protein